MSYYPLFINLEGKPCIVIGGGRVAERKIVSLLAAGAGVLVISPECSEQIRIWSKEGSIRLEERTFQPADIRGASIVMAATDNPDVNMSVYQATQPGQWINIVDRPDLCSFIVPSVVQRGDLTIAVSTGGNFPGLAKQLRKEIEAWIGDEYGEYTAFLGEVRKRVQQLSLGASEKVELLKALLDDQFREWTRIGKYQERDAAVEKLLENYRGMRD